MLSADVIERLESMSVLDLVELKRALEDRWGILPMAAPALLLPDLVDGSLPADVEEQTEFNVVLTNFGANKINVIKAVRELTTLGLKEAKELVESAPVTVKDALPKDEAAAAALKLRAAGATADVV